MSSSALSKVIVALDNMPKANVFHFLDKAGAELELVKIGLELFCSEGPQFVKEVVNRHQKKIFLDLKLHDIPNTVAQAINALKGLPIEFLTLHLSGGKGMLEEAILMAKEALPQTKLLGVSYLTSLDKQDFHNIQGIKEEEIPKAFERLFDLALETKVHGVVCSAHELKLVQNSEQKKSLKLIKICPGIRFQDEIDTCETGDQKRVMTPENAFREGAHFIVMGRSITQTDNLETRLQQLKKLKI